MAAGLAQGLVEMGLAEAEDEAGMPESLAEGMADGMAEDEVGLAASLAEGMADGMAEGQFR